MATDIDKYLSFILGMFVAFGATFEVPVVVVLLNRMGVVSLAQLRQARPYVIVGRFCAGRRDYAARCDFASVAGGAARLCFMKRGCGFAALSTRVCGMNEMCRPSENR